jgi:hypothetical protein
MNLLRLFRRQPPIRDFGELADFIDENAAFLVQRGMYEYARARAGHYAKVLFAEAEFLAAVEQSRWRAYPLGLAMVGEMVEGTLRESVRDRRALLDAFTALVLSVFDRYPVPAALEAEAWRVARAELARRLEHIGLHPPKRVIDIPEQFAADYFDLMPIHEKMRSKDEPTTRSYLKLSLCNIRDELVKRMDIPAIVGALKAAPAVTPEPAAFR